MFPHNQIPASGECGGTQCADGAVGVHRGPGAPSLAGALGNGVATMRASASAVLGFKYGAAGYLGKLLSCPGYSFLGKL